MIIHETTDANGERWEVGIETDVVPFRFPGLAVPPSDELFDFDAELRWRNETLAWPVNGDRAYRVVDHHNVQWEPPTEDELEQVRERRRKEEAELMGRV